MVKTLSIFCSVILVFIASYFFYDAEQISILPSVPSSVKPGDEFVVELTIGKGLVEGFANLQQYLPDGFAVTPIETAGADFSFDKQIVKFTWKELPKEKSFRISYKIKTALNCSGLKTLNGEFSYIESDQPKKVALIPSVIILNDDLPLTNAMLTEMNSDIKVEKSVGNNAPDDKSYLVQLIVRKGTKRNAARIFDQLLDGYTAKPVDTKGANFSVSNKLADFYWEELPKDSVFTVSYRLVPDSSVALPSYASNDLDNEDNGLTAAPDVCCTESANSPATADESSASTPVYMSIAAPQKGIYYKVQIAATKKSPERKSDFFKKKYKITEPVDLTMHEGWKKYMIGTFDHYSAAKKHRVETQAKVSDAFVVAYNNGERIPLKQAFKIKQSNQ